MGPVLAAPVCKPGAPEAKEMLIRKNLEGKVASSEITPKEIFFNRRNFLTGAIAAGVGALALKQVPVLLHPDAVHADSTLATVPSKYTVPDAQTPFAKATTYNNFYEFGTQKDEPAKYAHTLHTRPWSVEITGLVKQKKTADIDSIMKYRSIESRVYRHRCVEAWSMVIPWDGYSLSEFIAWAEPLPSAKYVQFISDEKSSDMPDKPGVLDWPYSEGLRMDEAMNPLCLLTFGCYGEVLPNQNGAPIRVVSPWKYGFKNGKSIVKIVFTDKQPHTSWNESAPQEYGFYSNVNPQVDHPRWSQAHERRIDSSPFPKTIPTQMFNGYADQVASLYSGMDLKKNF
jgi:sulfoxide reductase catalytic subunit YedY